jgi:hypothetical protein
MSEVLRQTALWIGCAVMSAGGLAILALCVWGAMELCWRQVRTVGLLMDIYHWRRAGRPSIRPQVLAKKPQP